MTHNITKSAIAEIDGDTAERIKCNIEQTEFFPKFPLQTLASCFAGVDRSAENTPVAGIKDVRFLIPQLHEIAFPDTLKTELVHHQHYATREEAGRDIFAYIEGFYNRTRRTRPSDISARSRWS